MQEGDEEEPAHKRSRLSELTAYTRDEIKKDLHENVQVWTDYLKPYIHPRSICQARDVVHEIDEFEMWKKGHQIMESEMQRDEFTDNLHFYLEDCDSLQCFQVFADTQNSWGAMAEDFLEYLRDEVGSKIPIITLGCSQFVKNYESVRFIFS
jgi:hypothetical protein